MLTGRTSALFCALARKTGNSGGGAFAVTPRIPFLRRGVRWVAPCPTGGECRPFVTDEPIEGDPMEQPEIEQVTEELPEFGLMIDIPSED